MLRLRPYSGHAIALMCIAEMAGCATPPANQNQNQNQNKWFAPQEQKQNKPQTNQKPVKPLPPPKQLTADQVAQMLEPDVRGVVAYYNSFDPWIWNENHAKAIGIIIQALFLSGPNVRGVFGDGIIHPKMYLLQPGANGQPDWKLAKEWSFDVEHSIDYRSKKETLQGWGYRFDLPFDNQDFSGQSVRMIIDFERADGRTFRSGKKDFRVPGSPPADPQNAQGTVR